MSSRSARVSSIRACPGRTFAQIPPTRAPRHNYDKFNALPKAATRGAAEAMAARQKKKEKKRKMKKK